MTLQVFSIRDTKAEAYMRPFFLQTKGLALRTFIELANNQGEDMHKHAGDYHLFHIGTYDDSTGKLTPLEVKENLGCAIDYINPGKSVVDSTADRKDSGDGH